MMALLALGLPSCSSSSDKGDQTASSSTTASTTGAPKAVITALPEGCDGGAPAAEAVVAFVSGGRSWAVSPDDAATLRCLFPTADAALFSFGPLGGRVALPGLEVRGVGATCPAHRAVLSPLDGSAGQPLAAGVDGPTAIIGRLDADHFVIAANGCGRPSDLYVAGGSPGGAPPRLLVQGVDTATLRRPEPTPPPPLPTNLPRAAVA
jgi:hypothetical protein